MNANRKSLKLRDNRDHEAINFRELTRTRKKLSDFSIWTGYRSRYAGLKRCLLILRDLIFDSRVEGGMPSLAAAPDGPDTRPLLSVNAASIISFS
jgi:hypothetical protein